MAANRWILVPARLHLLVAYTTQLHYIHLAAFALGQKMMLAEDRVLAREAGAGILPAFRRIGPTALLRGQKVVLAEDRVLAREASL